MAKADGSDAGKDPRQVKRLTLRAETLRELTASELGMVAGGVMPDDDKGSDLCDHPQTCQHRCTW